MRDRLEGGWPGPLKDNVVVIAIALRGSSFQKPIRKDVNVQTRNTLRGDFRKPVQRIRSILKSAVPLKYVCLIATHKHWRYSVRSRPAGGWFTSTKALFL